MRLDKPAPNQLHLKTMTVEIADRHLGISTAGGIEHFGSHHLFALNGQLDFEGVVNADLYAAFNRVIVGNWHGSDVMRVVITLYPMP